jgi:putative membrane protein insertion efficiency factor
MQKIKEKQTREKNTAMHITNIFNKFFILLINIYQKYISPISGPSCRHYPNCSEYSKQTIIKHGISKGLILSIARIIRCNPWSLGGFDPVPEKVSFRKPKTFKLTGNYQTKLYQQQKD